MYDNWAEGQIFAYNFFFTISITMTVGYFACPLPHFFAHLNFPNFNYHVS